MISSAFTSFLKTERAECNQLFASVRHQHPHIEGDSFHQFLREQLDPVINLLDQSGQSVGLFATAGYQHGLDLAAKRWLGKSEFYLDVKNLWRHVIPTCLPWISSNPDYWLSLFGNILYRLKSQNATTSTKWLELMAASASKCQSADELKKLGLVLAWVSGLACYRQAALEALSEISDELFVSITHADIKNRATIQQSLMNNRWLDFSMNQPKTFSMQKRFGGAVLFEGEFTEPPKVLAFNNQLYVTSANRIWMLFFDAFGEILIPAQDSLSAIHYQPDTRDLNEQLKLYLKMGLKDKLHDLASLASCAELDDTLALTSKDSFAVILLNR